MSDQPPTAQVILAEGYNRQRQEIAALQEQSEVDSRIVGKLQAELLAATEDSALLNKWEKGQWLIGVSSKGEWQAMGQTPGLIGRGFVGKSVRDVLRQIRDLT